MSPETGTGWPRVRADALVYPQYLPCAGAVGAHQWGQPRKARRSREDVLTGLGADRQLIAIECESYRFQLVEHVRSQYWREDVYDKLEKVTTRP